MSGERSLTESARGVVVPPGLLVVKGVAWGTVTGAAFAAALSALSTARDWPRPITGLAAPGADRREPVELLESLVQALLSGTAFGAIGGMLLGLLLGLTAAGTFTVLRLVFSPALLFVSVFSLSLAATPAALSVLTRSIGLPLVLVLGPALVAALPLADAVRAAVWPASRPIGARWWGHWLPWWLVTGGGAVIGGGCGAVYGALLGAVTIRRPAYEALVVPAGDDQVFLTGLATGAVAGAVLGAALGVAAAVALMGVVTPLRPEVGRWVVGPLAVVAALAVIVFGLAVMGRGYVVAAWVWIPATIALAPLVLAVAGMLHRDTADA